MRRVVAWPVAAVLILALAPSTATARTVSCGQVISQDTRLERDIRNCPGHGLVIGADGITLDLAGHRITGTPGATDRVGIDNRAGHDAVRVKNGTIHNFNIGVLLRGASDNRLRHLTLSGNGFSGIHLDHSNANRLERTVASDNFDGISLLDSDENHLTRNKTSGNFRGMVLSGSFNRVEGNEASGNSGSGITLEFSGPSSPSHNRVVGNVASGNGSGHGILVNGSDSLDNRVERNTTSGNYTYGILLTGSFSRVKDNLAFGNGLSGIELTRASDDRVIGNRARGNTDGVVVAEDASRILVLRNRTNRNRDDGIDVDNPNTTIGHNRANANADLGIEAVPGVTDAGGNAASGNGNPLQCVEVFCR